MSTCYGVERGIAAKGARASPSNAPLGPSSGHLSQLLCVDRGKHEEPTGKDAGTLSIQLMLCVLQLSSLEKGLEHLSTLSPADPSKESWASPTWQV